MALVTLQRSPTPSATSSASTSEEFGNEDDRKPNISLSDSFFMVKGAALFLQQGNSFQGQRSLQHVNKNAGDLPQHLQIMINLLRCEDRIKLAVRLESGWSERVRYMLIIYSIGRQDTEENILLGIDFASRESKSCTIGMVLHLWSDTTIRLDGDGGFSVNTAGKTHVFKPVSVQAMWSALQMLHKTCEVARRYNYFPGGLALVWAAYYESCISSDQSCINEWNTMQDLECMRPDSPILFMDKPNEGERTELVIKATLRSIMMSKDLENVTCKEIRNELEKKLSCNLKEYKEYIDNEMLLILGQMDKASPIFDYLYLGSEWNASNLEELHSAGSTLYSYSITSADMFQYWFGCLLLVDKGLCMDADGVPSAMKKFIAIMIALAALPPSNTTKKMDADGVPSAMKKFIAIMIALAALPPSNTTKKMDVNGVPPAMKKFIATAIMKALAALPPSNKRKRIGYILNVTREIDNFFPGLFAYYNIRVYDEETTDLLSHWNEAYHFINKAKKHNSKCLVHCKMGVSRSASTVIAYAMKEYGWSMEKAYNYVKQKRSVTRPNAGFLRQLSEYEGILDASKQRHNKLWRQHVELGLPTNEFDAIFPATFPPDNFESELNYSLNEDDVEAQALPGSRCFRHLIDSHELIEPPNRLLEVEDLERDALLDEVPLVQPYSTFRNKVNSDKRAEIESFANNSDFCEKEVRKKLEFEEDLNLKKPSVNLKAIENEMRKQKTISLVPSNDEQNIKKDNSNGSSKRSCPEDGEEDAIFGIINKVKPSYPSCKDCMYPSITMSSEACEDCPQLDPAVEQDSPTICTQPALLQHMTSAVLDRIHSRQLSDNFAESCPSHLQRVSKELDINNQKTDYKDFIDPEKQLVGITQPQSTTDEATMSKKDPRQAKDTKYLFFSKDLEKPTMHSYLMQHQESIIQLQKAGLVRKHTKELERLKSESTSVIKESPADSNVLKGITTKHGLAQSAEDSKESIEKTALASILEEVFQKTSTPCYFRMDQISSYTKDFLKTVCYTPSSSSISSNLTRSSSTDSIHSVRGKPGLVKQRTQEIETRMRLAGLTLSSPLKRSHSLAKLGSITFSCEDLSYDYDALQTSDCRSSKFRDNSVLFDTPLSPRKKESLNKTMESANASVKTEER